MMNSNAGAAIAFFGAIASVTWSATAAWIYWLKHRFDAPRREPLGDDRVARLEAAVDALSIEIERIGEAQRFTVKLLDERHAAPSSGPRAKPSEFPRNITPH